MPLSPFRLQLHRHLEGPVSVELVVKAGNVAEAGSFGRGLSQFLGYAHHTATSVPRRGARAARIGARTRPPPR